MLYLIVLVLGGLVGLLLKGKMSNLLLFKFEKVWILVLAVVLQMGVKIVSSYGWLNGASYSLIIQGTIYSLVFISFWFNRKQLGVLVIGMGCFFNVTAIMSNGGKMPVSFEALKKTGMLNTLEDLKAGLDGKHSLLQDETKFKFLSDVISLPKSLGYLMPVVSIGDLVIGLGLFLLIVGLIVGDRLPMKWGRNKNGGFINEKID